MKFNELLESERYQALDAAGQQKARAGYLQKIVAKNPSYQALSNDEKVVVADRILNYGADDSVKPIQHGRTFTERIAPLAHSGSALLFDIPKAIVAKSGEAMGIPKDVALKSVFPEQETAGGKALRFGASVPAYILGGGALKAAGAVKTASKVVNPVGRGALEGLAYTAPYAGSRAIYENPEAGLRDLAVGAGGGAAIGAAGVGIQKAQQGAKWASKQTMMEWLKPKEKFMRYGKAPESVVQVEDIVANNADDLMKKLKGRADSIGSEIDATLGAYPAKIDVSGSVRVVRNKINELKRVSPRENAGLISKLEDIESDLVGNIGKESKMSAKDAFALKNRVIKGNKVNPFSQNPEADRIVAETKRDIYRAITNELKANVPGTRKLFDRYGNLQSAIVSLDNRMLVSNRNMLSGMGQVLHGGMGGAVGAVVGGGSGAGVGALAGMALSQYMKTAHGRTRIANALWKFSQLGVKPTSTKAAPIIEEVLSGDPALSKLFKGDKGKAQLAEVLEEMQGLPSLDKSKALPGGQARPGLPNLPAEGVYNDIRGGQKPIRMGSSGLENLAIEQQMSIPDMERYIQTRYAEGAPQAELDALETWYARRMSGGTGVPDWNITSQPKGKVVESLQKEFKKQPAGEVRGEIKRSSYPAHNRPPQPGGSGVSGTNAPQGTPVSPKAGSQTGKGVPPPNDEPGKAAASSPRINSKSIAIATTAGVGGVSMANDSDAATTHKIDHSFIDQREGYSVKPYVPKYKSGKVIDNSGVTIGSGVDLGQLSEQGLKSLGVSQTIINKVKPALGVKGQKALGLTGKVNLDSKEIKQLSDMVREANFSKYIQYYEKQTGKKFSALPAQVQTAVGSVITQYGPSLYERAPKFNKAILANNVKAMDQELRNFGDKYPSRRRLEADLLKPLVSG